MNAEELIRMHLGNLMVQVAVLQAENAELKEKLQKYETAPTGPTLVKK